MRKAFLLPIVLLMAMSAAAGPPELLARAADSEIAKVRAMSGDDPLEWHTCCMKNAAECSGEGVRLTDCVEHHSGECDELGANCTRIVRWNQQDLCALSVIDTDQCGLEDADGDGAWCVMVNAGRCYNFEDPFETHCKCDWFDEDPPPSESWREGTRQVCDSRSDMCQN